MLFLYMLFLHMLFYIIIEKKCQMNLFEEFSAFAMSENLCKFRNSSSTSSSACYHRASNSCATPSEGAWTSPSDARAPGRRTLILSLSVKTSLHPRLRSPRRVLGGGSLASPQNVPNSPIVHSLSSYQNSDYHPITRKTRTIIQPQWRSELKPSLFSSLSCL